MSATKLIAAAVGDAPVNQFSTSDSSQHWVDLLASALDGMILLPFALLFVWGVHRLTLNRWFPVTAALATVFAIVASVMIHDHIAPIFGYSDKILEMFGLGRFWYLLMPAILISFGGALALAWWCKRHQQSVASK
ncbi:hypothetical protein [Qipengyuania sp. DGS5-3]|uniref:hypothetical protein n=1 Tax=Qipengyuania sp. DGS5-3 TaxID=3349632 RepID=UPI0036D3E231